MESIERCILTPSSAAGEVKVFYHLFEPTQIFNPRTGEKGMPTVDEYRAFEIHSGFIEAPNRCLEQWQYSEFCKFGDPYENNFQSLRNIIHQLHSLREVTLMVENYDPDVVVFARPDLLYHAPLPELFLRTAARRGRRCYLPLWQWWGGYNDRFAICGSKVFSAYGRRIEVALEYCRRTSRPLVGEMLLHFALGKKKAQVRTMSIRATRVRIGGHLHNEDFRPIATVGGRRHRPELMLRTALTYLGF